METAKCTLCGEPMPPGEEVFKFHGYSGPCPKPPMMSGAMQIATERGRQITAEGWSAEHDDRHINGELRDAAIAYAMICDDRAPFDLASVWPWEMKWWKPSDDPVRNLVKAGALIAAEIDRLQRKALNG